MKTTFIRKPYSRELMPQDEFVIDKVVEIDPDSFARFIHKPEGSTCARYAGAVPLILLEDK